MIDLLQKGSTLERKAWMARIRRMRRDEGVINKEVALALDILIQYGRDREIRTGRKKRGL